MSFSQNEPRYFHPEDELFSDDADTLSYPFTSQPSLEDQTLKTFGLLILLTKLEFEAAIGKMGSFFGL